MHEMGISNSVLEAVRAEAARHPGAQFRKVAVRIGELTAVDSSSLRFCFEALIRDTDFAALELEIETCPRRHRCPRCGAEFDIKDYDFQCSRCGEMATECISGDQLELAYLEVDEHESNIA
jgi:hydrogenase nickel incorporation protein HypA/HybF